MRRLLSTLLISVLAPSVFAQGAPPQGTANEPYTMEYYYKVQWGHQQEFLQLFLFMNLGIKPCIFIGSPQDHGHPIVNVTHERIG